MHNYEGEYHSNDLAQEIAELEVVFSRELTEKLAHTYIASLVRKLGGEGKSFAEFVEKGRKLHYHIGRTLYGPLIVGYCEWLGEQCAKIGHTGDVFFALRDAAPLLAAAQVVWRGSALRANGIYLNRPLLGIEDEIAPEAGAQNGAVLSYLEAKGLVANHEVIWADTGAWGTVILALKKSLLADVPLYPFFWYSHNPHIPGFLNGLLADTLFPGEMGEVLNDSMECVFPQQHLRPLAISNGAAGCEVILTPSNYLSVVWGKAALEGVTHTAYDLQRGVPYGVILRTVETLVLLSQKAKVDDIWTGVLPENTPTWSNGQEFVAKWPEGLLP